MSHLDVSPGDLPVLGAERGLAAQTQSLTPVHVSGTLNKTSNMRRLSEIYKETWRHITF